MKDILSALKWIAASVAAIVVVLVGRNAVRDIVKRSKPGTVEGGGDRWEDIDGKQIRVHPEDGETVDVELPKDVESKDVRAVRAPEKQEATVEVRHESIDRRSRIK